MTVAELLAIAETVAVIPVGADPADVPAESVNHVNVPAVLLEILVVVTANVELPTIPLVIVQTVPQDLLFALSLASLSPS